MTRHAASHHPRSAMLWALLALMLLVLIGLTWSANGSHDSLTLSSAPAALHAYVGVPAT